MENYRNGKGEKLAAAQTEFQRIGFSGRSDRQADSRAPLEPEISIHFKGNKCSFVPGDFLICEYTVGLDDEVVPNAIETSVLWITEGKGEEDIGVHFFERRKKLALTKETFNHPQRFSTVLPVSPASYDGRILKIHWCVRIRLFMSDGQIVTEDEPFQLGTVRIT